MSSGDQLCPCSVCNKQGHWESSHAGDYDNLQKVKQALNVVLDCVDYTKNNCKPTDMVGSVLPQNVIHDAMKTL